MSPTPHWVVVPMVKNRGKSYYRGMKKLLAFLLFLTLSVGCFGSTICEDAHDLASKIDNASVMVVSGSSMKPILRDGDVIVVKPIDAKKLKKGMVVVYKNNLGELVSHSVVSTSPLVFKGANNKVIDSDKCVEIVGVMYGAFYNWNNDNLDVGTKVLAKKY